MKLWLQNSYLKTEFLNLIYGILIITNSTKI